VLDSYVLIAILEYRPMSSIENGVCLLTFRATSAAYSCGSMLYLAAASAIAFSPAQAVSQSSSRGISMVTHSHTYRQALAQLHVRYKV
jgi:hypothetical protein